MRTIRDLSENQLRVGVEVVGEDGRPGVVSFISVEGYDSVAWVTFEGDSEPTLGIKNGDSDLNVTAFSRY